MASRVLTDEKIKARKLYVEDGITSFSELEDHVAVTRQTISRWAKEEAWANQRTSTLTSAPDIAKRVIKVLSQIVNEIEEMQANGVTPNPEQVKRMLSYAKSIRSLKDDYDEKGVLILFAKKLIGYLSSLPNERELLKGLQRVLPGFFSHIESAE